MDKLAQAMSYLESDEYEQAWTLLTELDAKKELDDEGIFSLGLAKLGMDDMDGAKQEFIKLIKKGSPYPYTDFALAQIFEKQGETEKAIYFYKRALRKRETFKDAKESLEYLNESKEIDEQSARIVELHPVKSTTKFSDVVGQKQAKEFLYSRIVLAMRKPELFQKHGKKMGIGVLLYSPPGCGKTYLARAVAGEADAYLLNARIEQILGEFVGSTEKNIHQLFQQARFNSPCIIFMDELDALGGKRSSMGGTSEEHGGSATMRVAVNQFLTEMNGIETNPEGIFVITATNRPWDIEPALKRSGRLGDSLYIPPPKYKERMASLKYHLAKKNHGFLNYGRLARATIGYSQADIEKICDDATMSPILKEHQAQARNKAQEEAGHFANPIKEHKLSTTNILMAIRNTPDTLDNWYIATRKEIIGRFDVEVVDRKVHQKWKSGDLEPDEKAQYRPMIKDIINNTRPITRMVKKLVRYTAIYLF